MLPSSTLANFPFLTPAEFEVACERLLQCLTLHSDFQAWANLGLAKQGDTVYITIVRSLENALPTHDTERDQVEDEDDDEVIQRNTTTKSCVHVEYHILLSPSYRVPVLYFWLRDVPPSRLLSTECIYDMLVPNLYKSPLRDVGISGAISYGDHPLTGTPAFFIHPCNSADAIRELAQSMRITLENYLQVWLGFIGGCVGLFMPSAHRAKATTDTLEQTYR